MTDPDLGLPLTDMQRDRAVEYLQRVYAAGNIDHLEFEKRLAVALGAQTRAELNSSLAGLAVIAPAQWQSTQLAASSHYSGAANVGAGLMHLMATPSLLVVPAIGRGLARPGSRISVEAGRAVWFQFSALVYGAGAVLLTLFGVLPWLVLGVGAMVWMLATMWLAVRAFSGEKSTAYVEWMMLGKPQEDRAAKHIR